MTATTEDLVEAVRTSNLDFETRRALYARLEAAVQQPNRADMRRAIEATEVWRVMGFNIDPVLDAILAALPIPATSEEQWGTAHAGQPEQIVTGIDEATTRGEVRSWNSQPRVMRGETPRGLLFKRTVGPWVEVTPA